MNTDQIRNEINRLDLHEKLQLVGDIWDAIACDNGQIPLSDTQKRELNERYAAFKAGTLTLENCTEVHEELRNRYN